MRMGGTYGGWRSLVGAAVELNDKKIRERGGPFPSMATNWRNYTTINIQSTRDGGGAMERRCDRSGARGMTRWRRFGRRIDREISKRKNTSRP